MMNKKNSKGDNRLMGVPLTVCAQNVLIMEAEGLVPPVLELLQILQGASTKRGREIKS
jgi:hypothetical protein